MVLGHCIQYGNPASFFKGGSAYNDVVHNFIYSFHMPIFALVSGYLFFPSVERKDPWHVLSDRTRQFMMPIMSWTIVYLLLHCAEPNFELLPATRNVALNLLWFLWAMFLCSSAVLVARSLFRDTLLFYSLLFCVLLFAPVASVVVFMYPYFVAGYLWHREGFDAKIQPLWKKYRIVITICLCLVWLLLFQFYTSDTYIYSTNINILSGKRNIITQLRIDLFRWAIGFAGSIAVLALIELTQPASFVAALGTKTLGIYVMSRFVEQSLPKYQYWGYAVNFLEAVIITTVCYCISVLISRNKTLNKILLGGR